MKTDYKFWYIMRKDDVHISECGVRFYEGDYETIEGKEVYKRYKRLEGRDLKHLNKKSKKETEGNDAIIYTSEDFGIISTDDELRDFLDGEISRDSTRSAIPEQDIKIVNKIKRFNKKELIINSTENFYENIKIIT